MQSMKTVPVQVVCRKCSHPYRTRVRGGNSRCPECATSRYVRKDQEWEGPVPSTLAGAASRAESVAGRLPVWCECRCGHEWQSQAKDRTTLHCPECGTGVRVPHRTHDNTAPTPPGPWPAPERAIRRQAPPPPDRAPAWTPPPTPPAPPAPPRPTSSSSIPSTPPGGLLGLLSGILGTSVPPPAPPTPARSRQVPPTRPVVPPRSRQVPQRSRAGSASTTAGVPQVPLQDPVQDQKRRERACQIVRSLGGSLLVWYDGTPPGWCEVLDTEQPRDRQRCPGTATRAVLFYNPPAAEVMAYACARHAEPLRSMADHTPYVEATVHPLGPAPRDSRPIGVPLYAAQCSYCISTPVPGGGTAEYVATARSIRGQLTLCRTHAAGEQDRARAAGDQSFRLIPIGS